jgi:uncharacterized repeat protein (TIGR01451 family)
MKLASVLRLLALLAFSSCSDIFAADVFTLSVIPSTTTPSTNGVIDYSMTVANNTGLTLVNTHLLSFFPSTFVVNTTSNNVVGSLPPNPAANPVTIGGGFVDFQIDTFPIGQVYSFLIELKMTQNTVFTNTVTVTNQLRAIGVTTNVVTGSTTGTTNTTGNTDLSVSIAGLPSAVLVNDLITYSLIATNGGSRTASRVIVHNTVPAGSIIVANSTASAVTKTGNDIAWQVGTLTNGGSQTLSLTIQTTNAAETTISANIQAPSNTDTAPANDSITNSLSIQPITTTNLTISVGPQKFNRADGLFEETVTFQNVGSVTVPTTRVFVAGVVSPDRLFNVAGTNGTTPYVLYPNPLAPGESTNVVVQLFFKDRQYDTSQTLTAVQGPILASTNTSTSISITNATTTNGVFTLQFPAASGKTYSIVQSDNVEFTNSTASLPITPATNRIVFTNVISANANRFFRALQNP